MLRACLAVQLLLVALCGCSRTANERTADAPLDDELVAAASGETASPGKATDPQAEFARRLGQLARKAEEHEHRGYYEQAIAAREELSQLLAQHFGDESWEARSARLALARAQRLHQMDSVQRTKNEEATAQERKARELWQKDQQREAIVALTEATALSADVWGTESYTVANLMDQLARWQIGAGEVSQAETSFLQALNIREKIYGRDHPDTVASLSALGLALQAEGRNAEAEPLLRDAADHACKVWGESRVEYATHLNNLAMLLHEMGRDVEAVDLMVKSTDVRRHALGNKHQVVGESLLNLGTTYYTLRDFNNAAPHFREALEIFTAALGLDHPRTRRARSHLGLTLMAQGNYQDAEELLQTDLNWIGKTLGEKHADYAEALARLAALYGNQGRYADALPLAEQAAAIHVAASGPDDPRSRQAQDLVAKVRVKLDRSANAETLGGDQAAGAKDRSARAARLQEPPLLQR